MTIRKTLSGSKGGSGGGVTRDGLIWMADGYRIHLPGEYDDKAGKPILNPLVAFELSALPNLNDLLYMSPMARKSAVAASRHKGYKAGLELCRKEDIPIIVVERKRRKADTHGYRIEVASRPLTRVKIYCKVHLWFERSKKDPLKGKRKHDVYNPIIKAFIDGLTDAGVWEDDSIEFHTDLLLTYRGLADSNRTLIEFLEVTGYGIQ